MAVMSIAKRTSARIALSQGTDPITGKAVTKYVTLSGLASDPDGQKILDVVDAAAPCPAGSVSGVETTEVKTLEEV